MTVDTRVAERRSVTPVGAPRKKGLRRPSSKWWYVLPAIIFLGSLAVYPLIQLVRLSLSSVAVQDLNSAWQFVGLENFIDAWARGELPASLGRTVVFVLIVAVLGLAIGLGAAVALRGRSWVGAPLMGLMVFIWALPPVVNGSVWKFLLAEEGLINEVITATGSAPFPFLYDERYALVSVAIVNAWALIPFNALVFRAAILNIPDELFEAAQLDGANASREFWHIIFPSLRGTVIVLGVLTVVYAFRSFDFVYVMTKGGPGTATQTLPYLSYQQAFVGYDFSGGAATAVLTVVLVMILAVVYSRSVLKEESE